MMSPSDRPAPAQPATPPQAQPQPQPQPPALATLWVASGNLLNLALPGRAFYPNQDPYSSSDFERKTTWLGAQLARLNPDVMGVQEVWDEAALKAVVARSGLQYAHVVAPGTGHGLPGEPGAQPGAEGTPRVGLVSRLALEDLQSVAEFAPAEALLVPELGLYNRFERPVLQARLRTRHGQVLHVLVAHLKSKRPKFLQDADGHPLEDRDDPTVMTRAALRSLVMRGAEAAALRGLVLRLIRRTREPLLLLGDLNDGPQSVTSQMIAATDAVAYDRQARDVALFHAYDVQTERALKRDMGYSHVHQGMPDILDQVWVSEEFVGGSRFALGDVRRVEYFNDHLHEGRDRSRSDHGFVRALLRLAVPANPPADKPPSAEHQDQPAVPSTTPPTAPLVTPTANPTTRTP